MASQVDITVPTSPDAYTAPVRQNFSIIADEITTLQNALAGLAGPYLPISGGILTGPLALASDPTTAMGAATKQYADTAIRDAIGAFLPLSGGALSGPLRLMSGAGALSTDANGDIDLYSPDASDTTMTGETYMWSGSNTGGGSSGWAGLGSGDSTGSSGGAEIWTGNSTNNFGSSGRINLYTGSANGAGNGTGHITLTTGATDGLATRGNIILDAGLTTITAPPYQGAGWPGMSPTLLLIGDTSTYGPALVFGPGQSTLVPTSTFAVMRYGDDLFISVMPTPGDDSQTVPETDMFSIGMSDGAWFYVPLSVSALANFATNVNVSGVLTVGSLATDGAGGLNLLTPTLPGPGDTADVQLGSGNGNGATGAVSIHTGATSSGPVGELDIYTGDAGAGSSGLIWIATGSSFGAGNQSGDIQLKTGSTDSIAVRGNVVINAATLVIENDNDPHIIGPALDIMATGPGNVGWAYIYTADQTGTDTSGAAGVGSGNSQNANSGDVFVYTGDSSGANSGSGTLATGNASGGTSGSIRIVTGVSGGAGVPSGNITLTTGAATGGGPRGQIILDGLLTSTPAALPTADPAVPGSWWVDPAAGFVLKVSQG